MLVQASSAARAVSSLRRASFHAMASARAMSSPPRGASRRERASSRSHSDASRSMVTSAQADQLPPPEPKSARPVVTSMRSASIPLAAEGTSSSRVDSEFARSSRSRRSSTRLPDSSTRNRRRVASLTVPASALASSAPSPASSCSVTSRTSASPGAMVPLSVAVRGTESPSPSTASDTVRGEPLRFWARNGKTSTSPSVA